MPSNELSDTITLEPTFDYAAYAAYAVAEAVETVKRTAPPYFMHRAESLFRTLDDLIDAGYAFEDAREGVVTLCPPHDPPGPWYRPYASGF
jgi:hypothetical protein